MHSSRACSFQILAFSKQKINHYCPSMPFTKEHFCTVGDLVRNVLILLHPRTTWRKWTKGFHPWPRGHSSSRCVALNTGYAFPWSTGAITRLRPFKSLWPLLSSSAPHQIHWGSSVLWKLWFVRLWLVQNCAGNDRLWWDRFSTKCKEWENIGIEEIKASRADMPMNHQNRVAKFDIMDETDVAVSYWYDFECCHTLINLAIPHYVGMAEDPCSQGKHVFVACHSHHLSSLQFSASECWWDCFQGAWRKHCISVHSCTRFFLLTALNWIMPRATLHYYVK